MYDIDRPKFLFVSLLEEFIRETEHSLAYFFALLIFLLTFLLALFGREALYTGLIGVLCLFLIKLRDIIESFKETRQNFIFYSPNGKKTRPAQMLLENLQTFYDDAALTVMADEFPQKFDKSSLKKADLLSYLQTCWKTIETLCLFLPDRPLSPETKQAVRKMTVAAQNYLLYYLEKKYSLTEEQIHDIEKSSFNPDTDALLLQARLEKAGIDEKTGQWVVRVTEILKKIRKRIDDVKPETTPS